MTAIAEPAPSRTGAAAARFAATNAVATRFFDENADAIARACQAMAQRFQQGGRMFVAGDGAQRSDVAHVVVEFVHPVIVGKRALPTLPLPDGRNSEALSALTALGRRGDLLLILAARTLGESARELLDRARSAGILAIALTGPAEALAVSADHHFAVASPDPCIVQETHEMLYHILWELVHVFFEHRAVGR